jgi:serine/threonine-protein kinase
VDSLSSVSALPDSCVRCPTCGDRVEGGRSTDGSCPFPDEIVCPVLLDAPDDGDLESLQETSAFPTKASAATPSSAADPDELLHSRLGTYRILEYVGQGSMARVYKGCHLTLGRISAIKVLSPDQVQRQPKIVEWFLGEARALAGLIHPSIVTIHNLGQDRGYHFVEMEYVRGGMTLKESVARHGVFEPINATLLVRQVAEALDAAHQAGLVHRDVKPANVLLTPGGDAKLADFGLARRWGDAGAGATNIAGTPTFMAPELFTGAPPSPRSDLYALGVTFYYLLTARLPFSSEKLRDLIKLHRFAPVPDPRLLAPELTDELATLLLRLLAKDPDARPSSSEILLDELEVVVGHLRDTESLVRESVEGLNCLVQQGGRDQFRILVPVPGDRLQEVYIEVSEGRKRERFLTVYSVCAPAEPKHYEFALRTNSELTHGGLSIREVHGSPMFVMSRNFARPSVTPADLRAAIVEIARRGDSVEKRLTSIDLY